MTCYRMLCKNDEPIGATKCFYLELVFGTPKDMRVFECASDVLFLVLGQTHCKKMNRFKIGACKTSDFNFNNNVQD